MREKLIELLNIFSVPGIYSLGEIADHLIANGVTIQQWIPVSERLPEEYVRVLAIDKVTGEVEIAQLNAFGSFVFRDGRGHGASYWMPLPEPPKEVT